MDVVIAGGSGLIGRHLCRSLLGAGHGVIVLTRAPLRARPLLPGAARVRPWGDEPSLIRDLGGAGAVVNLAGASIGTWPWTASRKRELIRSRLGPTRSLVRAIGALPATERPAVLLSASGTDRYEGRDAEPAAEDAPSSDTFLARLCDAWEHEAWAATALGVRVVLARLSLVLAPDAPALATLARPIRWGLGGPVGTGRQWVSWIALSDVVRLMHFALARGSLSGALNMAAPDPRPQHEVAALIAAIVRRPAIVRAPAWLARLVMGEQSILALGSRRVWPARALAAGFSFEEPRLEEALRAALAPRSPQALTG